MIRISVFYDGNPVTEFEQSGDKEITIGRAPGCAVRLDDPSISRLHALVRAQGGSWVLERKASFGAVLLNGQEVENAPLEGGEEITIGKFVLRIDMDEKSGESSVGTPSLAGDPGLYQEDDGRTKFVSSGVNGLFRFEPGSANVSEFLLQGEVALFGRGSNCDVVLTEKKASRKHCEVRKQGLSFFLKDLNSANGTLVNGTPVNGEVELVPGDVIQIGEAKCQFSVENKDYFSRQDQFLPVPAHLEEQGLMEVPGADQPAFGNEGMVPGAYGGQPGFAAEEAIPGIDPVASEPEPTSLVGKLKKKWFSIPKAQRMRYLTILVVFSLVSALLGGPDEEAPKPTRPRDVKARTYEALSSDQKRYVVENYKNLLAAHEKRDFNKMLEATGKILQYVDDYRDTKSFETVAKNGIEEIEEARRRKELQERQEAIRKEVAALEEKGRAVFEKAYVDPKFRRELDDVIQEIYSKDPNNRLAQEWKDQIKQKDEEEKQAAELARQKELLRQKAEAAYAEVEKIFQAEKYVAALQAADKLGEVGYSEQDYVDKVEALKNEIRTKLNSVIDPLMREASQQRQEGGDLVKAKELYMQVLKIDASNKEALGGLESIRETLHTRAKRFYAEAVLAESVSDLTEARDKFEKCLRTAPEEDIYKKRCYNKLSRFDVLSPTGSY